MALHKLCGPRNCRYCGAIYYYGTDYIFCFQYVLVNSVDLVEALDYLYVGRKFCLEHITMCTTVSHEFTSRHWLHYKIDYVVLRCICFQRFAVKKINAHVIIGIFVIIQLKGILHEICIYRS